jgi:hypothetical protein
MPVREFKPVVPDAARVQAHSVIDPMNGSVRLTEAQKAAELEQFFGAQLERSVNTLVDLVVNTGENVGMTVALPDKFYRGQFERLTVQLALHLINADFVPLDLRGLSASNVEKVEQFVRGLPPADNDRVIFIR